MPRASEQDPQAGDPTATAALRTMLVGISLHACTMRRARGTRQDTTGSTRRAVHDVQRNKYSRRAAFTVRRADWGYSACLPRAIWVLTVPIGTLLCCEKRRAAPNAVLARDVHKMHVSNAQPLNTQQRRCSYGAQYRARCRVAFSMPPAIVARTCCCWCPYRHAHRLTPVPISARVRWGGSVGSICAEHPAARARSACCQPPWWPHPAPSVAHRAFRTRRTRPRPRACLPVSSTARGPGGGGAGWAGLRLPAAAPCRRLA
jgi:hypothetical protein